MTRLRTVYLHLVLIIGFVLPAAMAAAQQENNAAKPKQRPATVTPAPKNDAWWKGRHEKMNARVKQGNVDLLFIGDSITQGWEGGGAKEIWQEYYGKRNTVNLGIGGDQTQHVLWRLQNGNLEGISPKLAVVMIGTNNSGGNTPEDIARGIRAIVRTLREKVPNAKVLVLAIFPRGKDNQDHLRQVVMKTNEILAKRAAGSGDVVFLDIGPKFLQPDGALSKEIMPDLLHLSAKGYKIWADAIEPEVEKVMGKK